MNKNILGKSKTPTGVKVISILYVLGAILMTVMGILMIANSVVANPFLAVYVPSAAGNVQVGGSFFVTGGIFAIAVAVFGVLLALALWTGKKWARIAALVLSGITLVLTLLSVLTGGNSDLPAYITWIVNLTALVMHGLIIWYLGFNKRALDYFN